MQKSPGSHAALLRPPRPDRLEHRRPAAGQPRYPAQSDRPRPGGALRRAACAICSPARDARPPTSTMCRARSARARDSMEIMRAALGIAPAGYAIEPRLAEISFGEWEGLTYDEVMLRDPDIVAKREADKWEFLPPGGENYRQVALRVGAWYATPRARHRGLRPWRDRAGPGGAARHRAARGGRAPGDRSRRGLRLGAGQHQPATPDREAAGLAAANVPI